MTPRPERARGQALARLLLATVPMVLLGALMLVDVGLNFANVVGRYVFSSPIFWAEEAMVQMTVWGVFLGMAAVAYRGEHLSMDLFSARLSGAPRRALETVVALATAACCAYVATQSWQIVRMFAETGAVSTTAGVPKAIPHAALLVGFGLTALATVVRLRALLRQAGGEATAAPVELERSPAR